METIQIGVPWEFIKQEVKKKMTDTARQKWNCLTKCRIARELWPDINEDKSKRILSLNKRELRKLIAAISGHCLIGTHAKHLKISNTDDFRFCNEGEEDMEHLYCDCPALAEKRSISLGNYYFETLAELSTVDFHKLLKFINVINVFKII